MEARLKEAIRKYVRERNIQKTLDEMSVTGNVAGYNTPAAFAKPGQTAKKNNRLAKVTGGTVVDNLEEGKFKKDDLVYNKRTKTVGIVRLGDDKYGEVKTDADGNVNVDELEKYNPIKHKHQQNAKVAPSTEKEVNSRGLFNPFKSESLKEFQTGFSNKKVDGKVIADISGMIVAENRWLELKRETSSPKAKVGRGVSNIHKQLSEIEKFVNWYSKIKTENGLKKEDYWKRTNASLYKIRERLMGITEKLRTL